MDTNFLASAGVSTGSMAIAYILYKVWKAVKGHRLVSDCCGKMYEVGVDVRDMPPTPTRLEMKSHPLLSPQAGQSSQNPPVSSVTQTEHQGEPKITSVENIRLPQQVEEARSVL